MQKLKKRRDIIGNRKVGQAKMERTKDNCVTYMQTMSGEYVEYRPLSRLEQLEYQIGFLEAEKESLEKLIEERKRERDTVAKRLSKRYD